MNQGCQKFRERLPMWACFFTKLPYTKRYRLSIGFYIGDESQSGGLAMAEGKREKRESKWWPKSKAEKPRYMGLRLTYMIRLILVVLFLTSPLFAQDDAAAARAAAGCGSERVNFDVKTDKKRHPAPQPEAGKGLVYVFADVPTGNYGDGVLWLTTRVGLDGDWVGANGRNSYFFFGVSPGDHRLCTNWQSSVGWRSKIAKAVTLTAEAGKTYYFRIRMLPVTEHQNEVMMKLEALDPAEGQLLIASSALSTSQPKK